MALDLNSVALEHLMSTRAAIVDPVFPSSKEFSKRVRFICSPPSSPAAGFRRPPVVTPDAGPLPWEAEALPPPLSLDGSPKAKRVKFFTSLSAVREEPAAAEGPPEPSSCGSCGAAPVACRGTAFARSDLDYFEPCAGSVCLECGAPPCGSCGAALVALPFCGPCLEMVQHEAGSHVARDSSFAKYLCKGGGGDCRCNALVCDDCHSEVAALAATGRVLEVEDAHKYVLQEPITKDTRLCDDCVCRLHDIIA